MLFFFLSFVLLTMQQNKKKKRISGPVTFQEVMNDCVMTNIASQEMFPIFVCVLHDHNNGVGFQCFFLFSLDICKKLFLWLWKRNCWVCFIECYYKLYIRILYTFGASNTIGLFDIKSIYTYYRPNRFYVK